MFKKTVLFLLLGIFSFIGLLKNASCDNNSPLSTYANYIRVDKPFGQEFLVGQDLRVFKNFPVSELKSFDNVENKQRLPELITYELTGKDFSQKLVGKTFYGLTYKQRPYALFFDKDHDVYLQMDDGRLEKGTYWYDASGLHAKLPTIHKGKPTTVRYFSTKFDSCYLSVNEEKKGYAIMVAKAGDTENLKKKMDNTLMRNLN